MTPQLRQAIQLLQFNNLEANTFVEAELERNPLLERDESTDNPDRERAALDQTVPRAEAVGDTATTVGADTCRPRARRRWIPITAKTTMPAASATAAR